MGTELDAATGLCFHAHQSNVVVQMSSDAEVFVEVEPVNGELFLLDVALLQFQCNQPFAFSFANKQHLRQYCSRRLASRRVLWGSPPDSAPQ